MRYVIVVFIALSSVLVPCSLAAQDLSVCVRKNGRMYMIGDSFRRQTCGKRDREMTVTVTGVPVVGTTDFISISDGSEIGDGAYELLALRSDGKLFGGIIEFNDGPNRYEILWTEDPLGNTPAPVARVDCTNSACVITTVDGRMWITDQDDDELKWFRVNMPPKP